MKNINGNLYLDMIKGGVARLARHKEEINALNVFPIPDGDTGDNMLFTAKGGVSYAEKDEGGNGLSHVARAVARGMLLSARGNSGVILSQFFEGIALGLDGFESADAQCLGAAFSRGVESAYGSVMVPTEGTVLTVMREATEHACSIKADDVTEFLRAFVEEGKRSLLRTPDILLVLKNISKNVIMVMGWIRCAVSLSKVTHSQKAAKLKSKLRQGHSVNQLAPLAFPTSVIPSEKWSTMKILSPGCES